MISQGLHSEIRPHTKRLFRVAVYVIIFMLASSAMLRVAYKASHSDRRGASRNGTARPVDNR